MGDGNSRASPEWIYGQVPNVGVLHGGDTDSVGEGTEEMTECLNAMANPGKSIDTGSPPVLPQLTPRSEWNSGRWAKFFMQNQEEFEIFEQYLNSDPPQRLAGFKLALMRKNKLKRDAEDARKAAEEARKKSLDEQRAKERAEQEKREEDQVLDAMLEDFEGPAARRAYRQQSKASRSTRSDSTAENADGSQPPPNGPARRRRGSRNQKRKPTRTRFDEGEEPETDPEIRTDRAPGQKRSNSRSQLGWDFREDPPEPIRHERLEVSNAPVMVPSRTTRVKREVPAVLPGSQFSQSDSEIVIPTANMYASTFEEHKSEI